jgi:hypothetical protein
MIYLQLEKASVITRAKSNMMTQFDCDNVGKIEEFLGNKIEFTMILKSKIHPASLVAEFER